MNSTTPSQPRPAPTTTLLDHLRKRGRGLGRFVLSRKMVYLLMGLLGLAALGWKIEDWHGEKVWQEAKEDMARRGISFSEIALAPGAADAENFAMHPVFATAKRAVDQRGITPQTPPEWDFAPLIEKYSLPTNANTEELAATERLQEYVTGINKAAQRPQKQWFPYQVAAGARDLMLQRPLPSFKGVVEFARIMGEGLAQRAQAQLEHQEPAAALQTVLAMVQTADLVNQDTSPSRVYGLVFGALSVELQARNLPHLELLMRHAAWREKDLETLAKALGAVDVAQAPAISLRRDLLFQLQTLLDQMEGKKYSALWEGFMKHNLANLYYQQLEEFLIPVQQAGQYESKEPAEPSRNPHYLFATVARPSLGLFVEKARHAQLLRDKLRLNCVLASHLMRTGKAAATWEAVDPNLLAKVPVNHFTGQPISLAEISPE